MDNMLDLEVGLGDVAQDYGAEVRVAGTLKNDVVRAVGAAGLGWQGHAIDYSGPEFDNNPVGRLSLVFDAAWRVGGAVRLGPMVAFDGLVIDADLNWGGCCYGTRFPKWIALGPIGMAWEPVVGLAMRTPGFELTTGAGLSSIYDMGTPLLRIEGLYAVTPAVRVGVRLERFEVLALLDVALARAAKR